MLPFQFQEIHIENTNSCGYKCVMCPREQQSRKIGFMSLDDFSFLLDRIGPFEGHFHLHGFGEPLLDRLLAQKIKLLKGKSPQAVTQIFSTLGVRVKEDCFTELAQAGLDSLGISMYGFQQDEYKKVHGYDGLELVKRNLGLLSQAMKLPGVSLDAAIKIPAASISSTLPIAPSPEKEAFCIWAQTLGFKIKQWPYVHNYGNGRNYNAPNQEKMCPVINGRRKNILNITWDLNVIPCCYDFNASIRFGNLREKTLAEIFSSPEYFKFLIAHKTGDLSAYPVCQTCEKADYE
ncbi:MAG: SPASM domain-containing protein [Chlamydiota bacterium]